MAGRPPKPTALKALQGNPGKRKLPTEPTSDPMPTTPPNWMTDAAAANWERLATRMVVLGILRETDYDAFALMVDALTDYQELTEAIREHGRTYAVTTESGSTMWRPNPEVVQAQDAYRRFVQLAGQFGMTPTGRAKVAAAAPGEEVDPFEQWASGTK